MTAAISAACCSKRSVDVGRPRSSNPVVVSVGGTGAKTCSGTIPAYMLCIPPSGSQTLIGEKVSPW